MSVLRRTGLLLAMCALGLAVAFGFAEAAVILVPCGTERLACSMTRIVGLIYIPVIAGAAFIAYALALFWKGTFSALTAAMLILLVPLIVFFAYIQATQLMVRENNEIRSGDIQALVQIAIPIVLTIVVPWAGLCYWLRRFPARATG